MATNKMGLSRAVQIISLDNDKLILDEDALADIMSKCYKNPVGIISIIGPARTGKSFLMNFVLQYFSPLSVNEQQRNWMTDVPPKLCFHYSAGTIPNTCGIYLWSEPIIYRGSDGQEFALLLMDTQGLYDKNTSNIGNKLLCSFSCLLSSLLVVNISKSFDEKYLQSFSEMFDFARMVMTEHRSNPLQELVFVVRDFDLDESLIGWTGGSKVMQSFLSINNHSQREDNKTIRDKMMTCFPYAKCFLLTHPGFLVTKKSYSGAIRDIDYRFLESLDSFCSGLKEHLKIRIIDGVPQSGTDWFILVQNLVDKLNNSANLTADDLKSILDVAQVVKLIGQSCDRARSEIEIREQEIFEQDKINSMTCDRLLTAISKAHAEIRETTRNNFAANEIVSRVSNITYDTNFSGTPTFILTHLVDKLLKMSMDTLTPIIESRRKDEEDKLKFESYLQTQLDLLKQETHLHESEEKTTARLAQIEIEQRQKHLTWKMEKEKMNMQLQMNLREERIRTKHCQNLLLYEQYHASFHPTEYRLYRERQKRERAFAAPVVESPTRVWQQIAKKSVDFCNVAIQTATNLNSDSMSEADIVQAVEAIDEEYLRQKMNASAMETSAVAQSSEHGFTYLDASTLRANASTQTEMPLVQRTMASAPEENVPKCEAGRQHQCSQTLAEDQGEVRFKSAV